MRRAIASAVAAFILSTGTASAALPTDEPARDVQVVDGALRTRVRERFVDSMRELQQLWDYLDATSGMRCPVPGSTFVPSFGAPRSGHSHQGVDMMADFDTVIVAPDDGVYDQHGYESFYLHAEDGTTYFGTHLGGHLAPDGPVVAGEPIALVSNTGNAAGGSPHLHFEIHPGGGSAIDPYPLTAEACFG